MKEKLRKLIILEGNDIFIVSLMLMVVMITFFPESQSVICMLGVFFVLGFICYLYSFIWCLIHACRNQEFDNGKRIVSILLIWFLNIFYIPIYYTKHVMKDKLWYGILDCIGYVICYLLIIALLVFSVIRDTKVLSPQKKKDILYTSNDGLVSLKIDNTWTCQTEDIGGNNLFCYETYGDESFGIFNYTDRNDSDFLLDFHVNQSIDILKEDGYSFVSQVVDPDFGFTRAILKKDQNKASTMTAIKFNTDNYITIVSYYNKGEEKDKFIDIFNSITPVKDTVENNA